MLNADLPFYPLVLFPCIPFTPSLHERYLFRQQKEEEFAVYEPYCANYTNASELMLLEEQNLMVRTLSRSHHRFFSQQDMVTMSAECPAIRG